MRQPLHGTLRRLVTRLVARLVTRYLEIMMGSRAMDLSMRSGVGEVLTRVVHADRPATSAPASVRSVEDPGARRPAGAAAAVRRQVPAREIVPVAADQRRP